MKHVKWVLVILALAVGISTLPGHGQESKKEPKKLNDQIAKGVSDLMKQKLGHSQKVLEGLALNDFDKIAKHAEELALVTKQARWKVVATPKYDLFSNDFRRSTEELIQKAKAKNLDGATLAYVDLTLACVKCHKYVREARDTRLDLPDQRVIVRAGE